MEMTRHFVEKIGYMPNRYVMPSRRLLLKHLKAKDGEAAAIEMKSLLQRLQRFHLAAYEKAR